MTTDWDDTLETLEFLIEDEIFQKERRKRKSAPVLAEDEEEEDLDE